MLDEEQLFQLSNRISKILETECKTNVEVGIVIQIITTSFTQSLITQYLEDHYNISKVVQ